MTIPAAIDRIDDLLPTTTVGQTLRSDGSRVRPSVDAIDADWYSDLNDAVAASDGTPVVCPSARTQTTQVTIPTALQNGFRLLGKGQQAPITYSGEGAFFKVDPNATPQTSTRRQYWLIDGLYLVGPGSGVAGSIGLHLNNALLGSVRDVFVTGFETGVKWDGHGLANGAACYYNHAYNLLVTACATAYHFASQANSNNVFGGRAALSATGVLVDTLTTDIGLFGIDIEANTGDPTYDAAVVVRGYGNQLMGCRLENSGATYDVAFDDAGGGTDGRKNTVVSYHSSGNVEGRVRWDTNRDNAVWWPGFVNLGDASASAHAQVVRGSRSVAADGEPFLDIEDTYASSGTPIGTRHRTRRFSVPYQAQVSDGAGTYYTTHEFSFANNKPHLWLGAFNSAAKDVNLYRDAANVLKTDDKLIAAGGIGVGNSAAATTLGTVVGKFEVFDASGASLGFVAILDGIS